MIARGDITPILLKGAMPAAATGVHDSTLRRTGSAPLRRVKGHRARAPARAARSVSIVLIQSLMPSHPGRAIPTHAPRVPPVTAKEAAIRDKLAQNLAILEPGLSLLKVEPHLPDENASGYIDILARDRLGLLVLIELKRSDPAARHAIHELFKYISLVVKNFGVPRTRIRCLIVSTTWRELWNPFSELKSSADIQVEGLELTVDDDGTPLEARPVQPPPIEEDHGVCPFYSVVCYENAATRNTAAERIAAEMQRLGFSKGAVVIQDYKGSNPAIVYPHCLTAAVGALSNRLHASDNSDEATEIDDQWREEMALISNIVNRARGAEFADVGGIGPEQFVGRFHSGWEYIRMLRTGPHWRDSSVLDDSTILQMLTGFQSRNAVYFEAVTSPRNHLDWEHRVGQLRKMLNTDRELYEIIDARLAKFRRESSGGAVAIRIFYPDDLLRMFYGPLLWAPRNSMTPDVQLWLDPQDGSDPSALYGILCWESERETYDFPKLIESAYRGVKGYMLACALHEHHTARSMILRETDMRWRVFESFPSQSGEPAFELLLQGLALARRPIRPGAFKTVDIFIHEHWNSVCELAELFDPYMINGTIASLRAQYASSEEICWGEQIEACQLCKRGLSNVMFDAYIPGVGAYACICQHCFVFHGFRLGLGHGQMYSRNSERRWQLAAGAADPNGQVGEE